MANDEQTTSEGNSGFWPIIIVAVVLVVATIIVAVFGRVPTVRQENAAAMLTLIAAGAVGIERVIEIFWTVMGLNGRPWWPFTSVGYRVQELVSTLNDTLRPLRDQVQEVVRSASQDA